MLVRTLGAEVNDCIEEDQVIDDDCPRLERGERAYRLLIVIGDFGVRILMFIPEFANPAFEGETEWRIAGDFLDSEMLAWSDERSGGVLEFQLILTVAR